MVWYCDSAIYPGIGKAVGTQEVFSGHCLRVVSVRRDRQLLKSRCL